jgi:hypothetical protein
MKKLSWPAAMLLAASLPPRVLAQDAAPAPVAPPLEIQLKVVYAKLSEEMGVELQWRIAAEAAQARIKQLEAQLAALKSPPPK